MNVKGLVSRLNNKTSRDLLNPKTLEIPIWEACDHDTAGRNAMDLREEYVHRILAAKGFSYHGQLERENPSYDIKKKIKSLGSAGFAYDRAAKAAHALGFSWAAMVCRIRAYIIWAGLEKTDSKNIGRYRKSKIMAAEHISSLCTEYSFEEIKKGVKPLSEDDPRLGRRRNYKLRGIEQEIRLGRRRKEDPAKGGKPMFSKRASKARRTIDDGDELNEELNGNIR